MTYAQLQRLLRVLKLNHERHRDADYDGSYNNSELCIENLAAIRFITGELGELLNNG